MGMTIQEILAAQRRAANATRKAPAAPAARTSSAAQTIGDILAAQRNSAAGVKPRIHAPQAPRTDSIAEIVARQRQVAAEQKAFRTNGMNPALTEDQKAVIAEVKERYNEFIAKLDAELEGQELFMTPPAETKTTGEAFTPNIQAPETEVSMEAVAPEAPVNGISVGDEMGGQVAVAIRPKRKRRVKVARDETEGSKG